MPCVTPVCEEMISKLDLDTIYEAFKVTAESNIVKREYFMEYIDRWAKSKQWLYEKMGRRLIIDGEYDITPNPNVIYKQIKRLSRNYPAYARQILTFTPNEWANNCVNGDYSNDGVRIWFPTLYKKDAKPSKILSKVLNDVNFDIELSKVLQNRQDKGKIFISIHPMDYIMMSTNTHKWGSCMNIFSEDGGFNKTGGYSLMMDGHTIICGCHHGVKEMFSNDWGRFEWIDMISRQIAVVDKNGYILGHKNGTPSKTAVDWWKKTIKNVLNINTKSAIGSLERAGRFYYDTVTYGAYTSDGSTINLEYGVKEMTCVRCGKKFKLLVSHHGWLTCNHCDKEE